MASDQREHGHLTSRDPVHKENIPVPLICDQIILRKEGADQTDVSS